jgi:predicted nucleic-acid-binding protein
VIALDTNVVVRFLVADDARQASRSRRILESAQVFIAASVLLETEWVLRGAYGLVRSDVVRLLRGLLGIPTVQTDDPALLAQALEWHARGLDFADALHIAGSAGADHFATFDAKLIKSARKLGAGKVTAA